MYTYYRLNLAKLLEVPVRKLHKISCTQNMYLLSKGGNMNNPKTNNYAEIKHKSYTNYLV